MTSVSSPSLRFHQSHRPSIGLIAVICVAGFGALTAIAYLLWPTWQAGPDADPARLPITIGSALFNVPATAIRTKMQRRAGPQERIDLAFAYPSLKPPEPPARITSDMVEDKPVASDRLFLSIASNGEVITPIERARTIYPRFVDEKVVLQNGLSGRAFRDTSPYRGEDLFVAEQPGIVVRCTRDGMTPGMCLNERRVEGAHLTFRFPRAWLSEWREVSGAMDRVVDSLRSQGS